MLKDKTIGVVVPAYNEERFIGKVIDTMPVFVDYIVVVSDASTDATADIVRGISKLNIKVILIDRAVNGGNGQALIDGYVECLRRNINVIAVMDGDGQMHPDDLEDVVRPVVEGGADYTKGNRLFDPEITVTMPTHRLLGNAVLTLLTKFATGYWSLVDPQCSYCAISHKALKKINITNMVRGYGYNADILNMLNIYGFHAVDVGVRPIYGEEQSYIKLHSYIPRIIGILTKLFFRRLWRRYVVFDFHPLVLFYLFAFFNTLFIILPLGIRFVYLYMRDGAAPMTTLTILSFTILITFQSILFAMWMDMDYNRRY